MQIEDLARDVAATLSKPRFKHVQGVVTTAVRLAVQHGESEERARTAAWLHDIAREWPRDKLFEAAESIEVPAGFASIPALLHGPIAAHIGRTVYGIEDVAILDAITYHTTGRPEMTVLDMVLFVADAIEPGRQFLGVEEICAAADRSLAEATRVSIDHTIRYLINAGKPLFPLTVLARNSLLTQ